MKRVIIRKSSFLGLLFFFISLFAIVSLAENEFVIQSGILTSYTGDGGTIDIPEGVLAIADNAFAEVSITSSVNIPASVNKIGKYAFSNYYSGLPYKVSYFSVDENNPYFSSAEGVLFDKNKSTLIKCPGYLIGSYVIPSSTKVISEGAFSGCKCLTGVSIPNGVTTIGGNAFFMCTELKEVTVPSSVTNMGGGVFGDCYGLEKAYVYAKVKDVGGCSFQGCGNLKTVVLPDTIEEMEGTFTFCSGLTSIILPSNLKKLGSHTFYDCRSLREIIIPEGIETIENVFPGCLGLIDMWIPYTVKAIDDDVPSSLLTVHCIKGTYADTWAKSKGYEIEYMLCPHYFSSWEPSKYATCQEEGSEQRVCLACGEKETKTTNRLTTHNWDNGKIISAATCAREGVITYTCRSGGETKSEPIPKTEAHKWSSWEVTKQATVNEIGEKKRICEVCGQEQTEVLTKLTPLLKIGKKSVKISKTKSIMLTATFVAGDAISAKSSNKSIVKVSVSANKVKITARKKPGIANVIVTTKTGKKAVIKVTVPKVKTKKITCKAVSVKKGKKVSLKPKVTPAYSDDKVTYKSANKKIATVTAKGVVKGIKKGKTTITVKSGKKSVKVKVTVK